MKRGKQKAKDGRDAHCLLARARFPFMIQVRSLLSKILGSGVCHIDVTEACSSVVRLESLVKCESVFAAMERR